MAIPAITRQSVRPINHPGTALLVIGAAAVASVAFLSGRIPLLGLGAAAALLLGLLPWATLFIVLSVISMFQSALGIEVAGLTFRVEELVLIPFALRAFLMTGRRVRPKWTVEWFLVGFLAVHYLSTWLHMPHRLRSYTAVGLLTFGVLAYLAVYTSSCTRRRLLLAARVVLGGLAGNAAFGVLATASHQLLGTAFGVSKNGVAFGLAYEANIFGSTTAAGALIFLALAREDNPLFSRGFSITAFWVCTGGMLLSLTRGAWLGYGVGIVVYLMLPRAGLRRRAQMERTASTLMVLGMLVMGVLWLAGAGNQARPTAGPVSGIVSSSETLLDLAGGTGRGRVQEWEVALGDVPDSLLFGFGTNSFASRHPQKDRAAYLGNLWVRTVHDVGIVGFGLFLVLAVSLAWPTKAVRRSSGDLAPLARALTLAWIVLIVAYAGTDSTYFVWPWILLGLTRAARVLATRQDAQLRAERRLKESAAVAAEGNGSGTQGLAHVAPWPARA